MTTSHRTRAVAVATALLLSVLTVLVGTSAPASAAPILPIKWNVDASTHMASLGIDVALTGGTFDGQIDLGTGDLTGTMSLPQSSTWIKLGSLPLAKATFAMQPVGPITGKVDLLTQTVTTTATFNIRLVSIKPLGLPFNLVGNRCTTATPISVTMGGKVDLSGPSSFTGTYAVPRFKDCGLLVTPIINLIAPGDGNTFTASFAPPAA
jgi:hypothetical protein